MNTPAPDTIIPHDYVWQRGIVLSPAQVDAYNRYTANINAATYPPSKEILRDNRHTFLVNALADASPTSVAPDVEYFPGATKCEIGQVMMQDVIGDYDVPDDVPEWIWVQKVASFEHKDNADSGIWEFVVNLSLWIVRNGQDEPAIPEKLVPVFNEAQAKGFQYLIFHQGT